ncbi:DUF2268 domain-containing protein [Intestinibacter sp.]
MKITEVRSDKVYNKILNAALDNKDDIYRYELMDEFAYKWSCYNVPIKAKQKGGYDVIMASSMLGYMRPSEINESKFGEVKSLGDDALWDLCTESIKKSLSLFIHAGVELKIEEYKYTILLPNPESIYTKLSESCCGDGGIPGSIFLSLLPNEDTIRKIPSVLAHECNHNVRFQFIKWSNDITLEEMMINEGLAENFATWIYGEYTLGPWVTSTDMETLNDYVKPIIKENLGVQGLEGITSFLYGDDIAVAQGYFPEGLPFCAGYACGYHMIKYYLNKTGKSIIEATLMPYEEIKKELADFWEC